MKLYAPKYYRNFKCIADKCKHSCCIGWEIDVDSDALNKYRASEEAYAKSITESIELGNGEEAPHFKLSQGERCPHLCDSGLCRIILELGEDYLCHICREHPRFYNYTRDRKEVGLGLACEEACRIILSSDDYATCEKIGETDEEILDCDGYDALPERENIYSMLSNRSVSYTERLCTIQKEYGVSPEEIPDERWEELLSSLEYLNEDNKALLSHYSSHTHVPRELEKYLERALAYFIYRHVSPAYDENELRVSLGLALFLERLLVSAIMANGDLCESAIFNVARILSEELEYSEENTEAVKFEFEM